MTKWQWQGKGDSPRFRISTPVWRVMWSAATDSPGTGQFDIDIYKTNGTFYLRLFDSGLIPPSSLEGPMHGTLGARGPGNFFLRITTTRSFDLTVQEQR